MPGYDSSNEGMDGVNLLKKAANAPGKLLKNT
jgi:hypothetical protein